MLVHFVGQQDRYQLGNTGKDQVSMEGLFVLCFPSGKAKRLFNSNFPHQKWDSHLEKSIL